MKVWGDVTLKKYDSSSMDKINKRRILLILEKIDNVPQYFYDKILYGLDLPKDYWDKLRNWMDTGDITNEEKDQQ